MPGFELIGAEEQAEVNEVFERGGILFRHSFDSLRNDCYKVREFEEAFAKTMQVDRALAVTSGTAALRVALAAIGVGSGDEVITQSFTSSLLRYPFYFYLLYFNISKYKLNLL